MEWSYISTYYSKPLQYKTFCQIFDFHCAQNPDKEAVVFYDHSFCYFRATFKELQEKSWNYACCLIEAFPWLKPSVRIAVVGTNRPEILLVELAAYRIGNVIAFPPTGIRSGADLAEAIQATKAELLVFESSYVNKEAVETILKTTSCKSAITYGEENKFQKADDVLLWEDVFCRAKPTSQLTKEEAVNRFRNISPESELFIYFTSGTTAKPKGMLHTHFGIVNDQMPYSEPLLIDRNSRFLIDRPMTNVGGSMFASRLIAMNGSTSVVLKVSSAQNPTDLDSIFRVIELEKITHILIYGYMMHDFVTNPKNVAERLGNVRVALTGAEPPNQELLHLWRKMLPKVKLIEGYGMSEIGAIVISNDTTEAEYTGQVMPNHEVKIVDKEGNTVPVGVTGELYCRSPNIMKGYVTEKGLVPSRDVNGWFPTDDLAKMNSKGDVKVFGRKSDVIKKASVLVFPSAVEKILSFHPKVTEVLVVGVSDRRLYQEICACVLHSDPTLTELEIRNWCEDKFQIDAKTGMKFAPRYYLFFEDFPRTKTGKTNRRELARLAETMIHKK